MILFKIFSVVLSILHFVLQTYFMCFPIWSIVCICVLHYYDFCLILLSCNRFFWIYETRARVCVSAYACAAPVRREKYRPDV